MPLRDTSYYVISARLVKGRRFVAEPGPLRYLRVPLAETPRPDHEIDGARWAKRVRDLADGDYDDRIGDAGDVLIFVHGYNNDAAIIRDRQLRLAADLQAERWRGVVIAFDWPSEDSTLNYHEDREDASSVALSMVTGGIQLLASGQGSGCQTNVHLVGHSTGAYVIMEAFTQATKFGDLHKSPWRVAQIAFIGADVSAGSLARDSEWARPLLDRSMRLTNYQNGFDHVLAVSNAKRLGTAPRVGRVGLPDDAHPKCVNVDCSDYFSRLDPKSQPAFGTFAHSWHIGNRVFARDLAMTMEGRFDRAAIPTRIHRDGQLHLRDAPRPEFESAWADGPRR